MHHVLTIMRLFLPAWPVPKRPRQPRLISRNLAENASDVVKQPVFEKVIRGDPYTSSTQRRLTVVSLTNLGDHFDIGGEPDSRGGLR
jgi:hypothetical protein